MSDFAIEARNLSKTFPGGVVAVRGLDLTVERGTVYGLIGKNGAGKTTTLRMLMGLLRPSEGTARVLGAVLWNAPRETRATVAYVPQIKQLHGWMTLAEHCHYADHFYERWDGAYARDLARRFELVWDRQVGLMSGGERSKVAMLLAFAARPEALILDEPAEGFDPIARRQLVDEIVDIISGTEARTVLFSTHIISDLERVAEHVGIMDEGRMIMTARLEDLRSATRRVQVIFDGDAPPADFAVPGAVRSEVSGPVVTAIVQLSGEEQLNPIRRLPGVRVNVFPIGLEDIFIGLLGPSAREELTEETP